MSISDFFSTMRNDGQRLNREEANLIAEDQRLENPRKHIEDLVAKATGGVRKRAADAVAHLIAHHLNPASLAATSLAAPGVPTAPAGSRTSQAGSPARRSAPAA